MGKERLDLMVLILPWTYFDDGGCPFALNRKLATKRVINQLDGWWEAQY
jgi:hypothetical protein